MISLERKIFAGLVAVLLLVASVASIAYWNLARFISATDWVRRTHEVIEALDGVQSVVQRAESNQRSYLLTGDASYLEERGLGRRELDRRIAMLEHVIAENPTQRSRGILLNADIEETMRRLNDGIAARNAGGIGAAIRQVGRGPGRGAMDRFRNRISIMKGTEQILLENRERDLEWKAAQAQVTIGLFCALGLAMVFGVFWAIFRDLAGRRRAEQMASRLNRELEQRVLQLDQANQALESFSSSVSHDLRAPLRSINGFGQVLLEEYSGRLDDRGRNFLRRVLDASDRMGMLIEDLLKLARISQVEMSRVDVDLSAMARSICAQLQAAEPSRQADFEIQPGLRTMGDPGLLEIALDNLFGNAWKFTRKVRSARIKFGAIDQRETSAFFIADNGAGFDMAFYSSLFHPFRRLHKDSEFKGTGVGLATVQRIVERHGGSIWAEAEPGKGATFYFTLAPAREPSGPGGPASSARERIDTPNLRARS